MSLVPEAIVYVVNKTSLNAMRVGNTLKLLVEEECTVPFISRYRKEVTGGMDEVQIRSCQELYDEYIETEKRRVYVIETIKKMEKLTPELEKKILNASTLNEIEDIYAPYKSKKKTKAQTAKEQGLEPLSNLLLESNLDLDAIEKAHSSDFLGKHEKIKTFEDALKGAMDIITESISHDTELKQEFRDTYWSIGTFSASVKKGVEENKDYLKFKDFFEYNEKLSDLKDPKSTHRYLAMRRGMTLKVLKIEVDKHADYAQSKIREKFFPEEKNLGCRPTLEKCATRAYDLHIHPSLDLEIKTELKKLADEAAIKVFGVNLKNLLLQPYLGAKAVMAIDPGVRTGCKVVLINQSGDYVGDFVIYPFPPRNDLQGSALLVQKALEAHEIKHVCIGNGTYGRETLEFLEKAVPLIKDGKVKATLINEAGASVYSASDIAREEFPDKDVTVRGSISIARRFQDPLAELVKIDPKSIGVGQYQHDVNQVKLKKSLDGVVESCVNFVGVDLNTASAPLLSFVSGIGPSVAKNIVKERAKRKGFKTRTDLLEIPRFSKKVFEQAAGFLRIYSGLNPLDGTFIHPEQYSSLEDWAKTQSISLSDLINNPEALRKLESDSSLKELIGEMTFDDIVKSLKAPSQDPRTEFKSIEFHKDLKDMNDLKEGSWYTGVVNNITNFGAFVDIGIKESGLLHISQISDEFVENPLDKLKVGQEVKVKVIEIDRERKRISLSCKSDGQVNYSGKSASGSRPQKSNKSSDRAKGPNKQAQMKNNAFAALKNLKL